jgi:hypothetical protein
MKTTKNKLQQIFTEHLFKEGAVELALPNGMVLEVGITQENKYGDLEKTQDYCWVIASQKNRSVSIDRYNLGMRYSGEKERVCEYSSLSEDGTNVKVFDVM